MDLREMLWRLVAEDGILDGWRSLLDISKANFIMMVMSELPVAGNCESMSGIPVFWRIRHFRRDSSRLLPAVCQDYGLQFATERFFRQARQVTVLSAVYFMLCLCGEKGRTLDRLV